jgi:hypothetical protein
MNPPRVPRDDLIERCRRQRARLAGMTGAALQRVHARDVGRVLRILRRALRVIGPR